MTSSPERPLTFEFIEEGSQILLCLTNEGDQTLKRVEVLTIPLKGEETPDGGYSQVYIKFKGTDRISPKEKVVLSHRTWIEGKATDLNQDQLKRLKVIAGEVTPYVLNISWEDEAGKSRFQRIPIGH